MRTTLRKSSTLFTCLVALAICVGIMVCAPLLSMAHVPLTTSITIVNNSGREIHHVYLSAPDQNNWGSDQLSNSVIAPNGGSFTISNASCGGSGVKVIAEDQDGCFSYQVVSCSESATWTITNNTARDCGN
ncbi:MAG TPA: hypothetical protein VJ306_21175 [Pyrinomonadaceae bacterium]|jgi:hypothetical protein|nr:hypothetical protein [Pyrinomonadaceae bacterium]